VSILACAANNAQAGDTLITRAAYVGGQIANSPSLLLIHGNFSNGNTPVVKLGDVSTATTSGNPASPDLAVTSFSTTDITVVVNHPLVSGLLPAVYRLDVRTFDAAEREWHADHIDLPLGASDLGLLVFNGTIFSVAAPNFTVANVTVGNVTVVTDNTTVFGGAGNPKSLSDIKVGDRVVVTVQKQADGTLLASSVARLP
jgi:Domain of unknown function (DUF5666)